MRGLSTCMYSFIRFVSLDVAEAGCTEPWGIKHILLLKTDLKESPMVHFPIHYFNFTPITSNNNPRMTRGIQSGKGLPPYESHTLFTPYCRLLGYVSVCSHCGSSMCAQDVNKSVLGYMVLESWRPPMNLHSPENFTHYIARVQNISKNLRDTSKF
jgi:hypothetical protein